jgi:transposase-like protein
MRQYSAEFKANIVAKMLPPHHQPIPDLARETQIPRDTLYSWRTQALKAGGDLSAAATPAERDSAEKFAIVVETAHLNAEELSAYCRRQGLYPQQLEAWRSACIQANAPVCRQAERAQRRQDQKRIKALEQEMARKDQALAEAAALLMLEKKARRLFADPGDA